MAANLNVPVLIGAVPLLYVTNLVLSEGYQVQRISGSRLAQMVAPSAKTIQVDAVLLGSDRLLVKKALEAIALTSRALASAMAPLMALAGVPVISGLTITPDMQVTSLRFSQSNQKREAIDVSISLEQVPRSSLVQLIGEAADTVLAAGSAAIPSPASLPALPRPLGGPL